MKKVVARKMGLTTKELNKKYFNKNKEHSCNSSKAPIE